MKDLSAKLLEVIDSPAASFVRGLLGGPRSDPALEAHDIQGNIVSGFNKDYQTLVFLRIDNVLLARQWIGHVTDHVATLSEVAAFNRLYKRMRARRGRVARALQSTWVHVAFTAPGLRKLTRDADRLRDSAFLEGMDRHSLLLGDPTDRHSPGYCGNWLVGSPKTVPDILLLVAGDLAERVAIEIEQLLKGRTGVATLHVERGEAPFPPHAAHEHFGFRDGISQPGVRGHVDGEWVTTRRNPDDPGQGAPGQNLIWPGEFVFGYPAQDPLDRRRAGTIREGGPQWTTNGSYLVFRRYRQNVEAFQRHLDAAADPAHFAATLAGRWKSGAPLLTTPRQDDPRLGDDPCIDNRFRYREAVPPMSPTAECGRKSYPPSLADPDGLVCPHAAHIRKSYPRDDLDDSVETHRMLRRGIPFGSYGDDSAERGLLFLAYMTSIEQQFEFVVRHWHNNPDFLRRGAGYDPIVGPGGDPEQRWVIPTGGAYFFVPAISTLRLFANGR